MNTKATTKLHLHNYVTALHPFRPLKLRIKIHGNVHGALLIFPGALSSSIFMQQETRKSVLKQSRTIERRKPNCIRRLIRNIIDRESGVKLSGHDDYPNLTIRFMRASLRLARAADGSNLRGTLFYNSPLFTKFSLGGFPSGRPARYGRRS